MLVLFPEIKIPLSFPNSVIEFPPISTLEQFQSLIPEENELELSVVKTQLLITILVTLTQYSPVAEDSLMSK